MSEEIENETTGHFNIRFNCPAGELCRTTTAGASPNAAAACTGTTSGTHSPASASPTST